ncbi:MAG TPA: formate dehydrogenase subunit alpha [Candidatus Hydrogenedentes bacterium]|nr:formate dehydrogenase subunit alpha [Candidatus Hydrogenedentota bacterium]
MNLTIDGREITAEEGQSVLEAARAAGVYIPSLCYHPRTGAAARCRACVVEIEGLRGLQTSCTVAARDGMVVQTQTPAVMATRRMIVELLLANGNHDCISCEANGACELQDMAYRLGIEHPAFFVSGEAQPVDDSSEGIIRDLGKCIHCGRCVAGCNNTVMHEVLNFGHRGARLEIICDIYKPMGESTCVQCGECVQLCPVGALIFKPSKGRARAWEVERKEVICPYCGVGCVIDMGVKDGRYVWALGSETDWRNRPNQGMLCVKGRFGLEYLNSPDRLTTPLIRRNGSLEPATWDEALDFAAKELQAVRQKHGADAIGCLSSAKVTNEENYAMQRFARAVIGTNNVDHCARLCHASTVAGLATTLGSGAMTNSMQEASKSDVILITGSNTTWCHPVFGGMIKKAVKQHGVKLIVLDPRETDLAAIADIHLRQNNGTDVAWLMGMQHIIVREGWQNQAYIDERCEGWEEYKESLAFYTPEKVEELTGIPADRLFEAAKLYATGGVAAIYFSMGITQHSHGVDNVKACANLALITGNLGVEGGGVNPLRGQSNVQGACDMGALPNVFSGYQPVADEAARKKFAAAWGVNDTFLSGKVGQTVTTMINACGEEIRALYFMGENPMVSDPNLNHVEEQLEKLDFLIVQDIFLTETASMADVVFPGVAFAEKSGTYTNTERRVQLSRAAIEPPAGARQDYEIIAEMASRLGCADFPRTPEALFAEVKALTPSYHGMTYDRIEANRGLRWPCPTEDHPGTPILHIGKFPRGKGLLSALPYRPPAEEPDAEYPMRLSTGRILQHYHTGSMSRRASVLDRLVPHGDVEIHPEDALELGLADGVKVKVATRRGEVVTIARVTPRVAPGSLFMAFHFAEAAANRLTNDALDPVAKIPEFKICAARLEAVE